MFIPTINKKTGAVELVDTNNPVIEWDIEDHIFVNLEKEANTGDMTLDWDNVSWNGWTESQKRRALVQKNVQKAEQVIEAVKAKITETPTEIPVIE